MKPAKPTLEKEIIVELGKEVIRIGKWRSKIDLFIIGIIILIFVIISYLAYDYLVL